MNRRAHRPAAHRLAAHRPVDRGQGRLRGSPRGARQAALSALVKFHESRDARVGDELDTARLSRRDAALAQEIVRGVVRRQSLLDHLLEGFCARGLPSAAEVLVALRVGAYQIVFLDRVPVHAAVDETVRLVDNRRRGFVNALLRRVGAAVAGRPADPARARVEVPLGVTRCLVLSRPLPDPEVDLPAHLAVISGLPRFLLGRWRDAHGPEGVRRLAEASNRTPEVHLRAVGVPAAELAARLAAAGVETAPSEHPRLLRWTGGQSPFATAAFAEGRFVVQDPTAVRAAEAVGALPGETVLDLCAAPGTKATLLAEAVGPTGSVLAYDVAVERRARIVENAARLGLPWIRIVEDTSRLPLVDRVLVDVPCSNSGVLARRVEVRHRIDPVAIASLAALQRELLEVGLDRVRAGGTVVYSTCSIEPDEGDGVVEAVVAGRADTLVVERVLTLPDPPRHDGGYYAVLRRDDPGSDSLRDPSPSEAPPR